MAVVTGLLVVVAALLVVAGLDKLRDPAATASSLREARLPSSSALVRMLGTVEVGVGGVTLVQGGVVPAAVLAAAYAVVTVVAVRQRRAGADCGCFGASSGTVTGLHVAVDGAAVAVAVAAAVLGVPGIADVVPTTPWAGIPALLAAGVAVSLLRAAMVRLPELATAEGLHPEVRS